MIIYKCDICGKETMYASEVIRPEWFDSKRVVICDDCKYTLQNVTGYNFNDVDFLISILRIAFPN